MLTNTEAEVLGPQEKTRDVEKVRFIIGEDLWEWIQMFFLLGLIQTWIASPIPPYNRMACR